MTPPQPDRLVIASERLGASEQSRFTSRMCFQADVARAARLENDEGLTNAPSPAH
jgi:hypothetical protein